VPTGRLDAAYASPRGQPRGLPAAILLRRVVGVGLPDPAFTTTRTFLHVLSRMGMLDLTWRHYVESMFPCTFTFNISHRVALRGLQRRCGPSHPFGKHIERKERRDLARGVVCALRSFVQRYGSFHTITAALTKALYFTSWGRREAEPLSAILPLLDYASLATR
jgi:hypothetical protein